MLPTAEDIHTEQTLLHMYTGHVLTSTPEKRREIKLIKLEVLKLHFVTM